IPDFPLGWLRPSDFGFRYYFGPRISALGFRLCVFAASIVVASSSLGCRRDMFHQPYSKPLTRNDFFEDNHMASRPLPAHTVARGHLNSDTAFYEGKMGTNL